MSADPLRATFVTETEDLLAQMEDGLLRLEDAPDDREVLNAIFRSGHTVKGSAGILGLKPIVAFTHVLENVLDRMRKQELAIDRPLISVLLDGKDVLAGMVAAVAAEREPGESPRQAEVLSALRTHADLRLAPAAAAAPAPRSALAAPVTWRITLRLKPDVLAQGQDPYLLLLELGDLGELLGVEAHADALPPFEQLDVFTCHLTWTVVLRSTASRDRLLDVFVFVREEAGIEVQQVLDCAHWSCSSP